MLKKIALVGVFCFASTISTGVASFASTKSSGPSISVRAPAPKGFCYAFMCH